LNSALTRLQLEQIRLAPQITKLQNYPITKFPMDSAEQLQRIYLAGFELQTFDRYPKCVGVIRDHCIALLVPGVDGLQMLGTPGWRIGEVMGVLTEVQGRKVFQAKSEIVEATPERLEALRRFREELNQILKSAGETRPPNQP
jgi:hypothetical protein